ncbi:protein-disulfide reductase DsbD family protein [Dyella sp. 2RAB6]|uniref:protein-disulfide reductase DsbD family protein n=1 Tax=Dyella sp. 2RAB6 TaxID=3232992 RepID=UPI003F8FF94C
MQPIRFIRPTARFIALAWLLLALLLSGMSSAWAQDDDNILPVTEAYKLKADASTPGVLKLHWDIAPDYYLYRGRMKFTGADGVTAGEARLPDGAKHHDEYLGDVEIYHHEVEASVPYTVAPGTQRLKIAVRYQGCHEVEPKICYPPHTEQLDLALPAGTAQADTAAPQTLGSALAQLGGTSASTPGTDAAALPAEQAFRFEALARAPNQLLLRWTMPKGYYLYRDQTSLHLNAAGLKLGQPQWPQGTVKQDPHFGNVTVYFDQVELPVAIEGDTSKLKQVAIEASFQGCQDGGLCYPLMSRAVSVDLAGGAVATGEAVAGPAPEARPAATLDVSLWAALLLALGGGLVLNLMPCVLPVLSIKAVGLIESGESPAHRRRHALAYTAGVLVSFVVLGLVILSLKAAWGAQLQKPLVVATLSLVMLAVALSMSGVVQFGASLGNTGSGLASRAGLVGDFFTGVLAVVVASPCTAPFMGSALAYALAAPTAQAMLVFVMLGLGLALPFLAVGYVPALARLLPRPGAWMDTLKQVLAFPMYLAAAWLAWVLANQRGADAVGLLLVASVMLAMALWWFERARYRSTGARILTVLPLLLALAPLYYLAHLPAPVAAAAAEGTVAFTPARLAELRKAGTPVFVDMTADWCITCKANEHAVLATDAFRDLLKRTGAVYMKGDWTNEDPDITAFLQQYHTPGVPLYVVFPKNGGEGRKLPTVLTSSLVDEALTEAAK